MSAPFTGTVVRRRPGGRLVEHLPGKHNQATHGKSGAGRALARVQKAPVTERWGGGSDQSFDDYMGEMYGHAGRTPSGVGLDHIEVKGLGYKDGDLFVYHGPAGPAGYVLVNKELSTIKSVAVRPSSRGQGIGMKMYDSVQDSGGADLYGAIGNSGTFTTAGKEFATKWLTHRLGG